MNIGIYSNGIWVEGNELRKTEDKSRLALMKDRQVIAQIDIKNYRLHHAIDMLPGKGKFYKLVRKEKSNK